jgi:hypothetical protein
MRSAMRSSRNEAHSLVATGGATERNRARFDIVSGAAAYRFEVGQLRPAGARAVQCLSGLLRGTRTGLLRDARLAPVTDSSMTDGES